MRFLIPSFYVTMTISYVFFFDRFEISFTCCIMSCDYIYFIGILIQNKIKSSSMLNRLYDFHVQKQNKNEGRLYLRSDWERNENKNSTPEAIYEPNQEPFRTRYNHDQPPTVPPSYHLSHCSKMPKQGWRLCVIC